MSIKVMASAWTAHIGSATAKIVLLKMADCAADDGSSCYPSIARLQSETELCERAVRSAIRKLEDDGFIKMVERGWGSRASVYKIDLEKLASSQPEIRHQMPTIGNDVPTIRHDMLPRHQMPPAPDADNSAPRAGNLAPDADNSAPDAPSTIIYPSSIHHLTVNGDVADAAAAATPQALIEFDLFLAAYPRRCSTFKARQQFTAARTRTDAATIIAGARRYAALCQHEKTIERLIATPQAWLEAQGWRNDYRFTAKPQRASL